MSVRRICNIRPSEDAQGKLGVDAYEDSETQKGSFVADGDIDSDGPNGNPDNDPYWQPHTTLRLNGRSIDSYKVPGVVVPPAFIKGVKGIVLGSLARVTDLQTKKSTMCVVYDVGPTKKFGEVSVEAAKRIGIPHNPNTGGVDDYNRLSYEIWPGIPAKIDGIQYNLQPYVS